MCGIAGMLGRNGRRVSAEPVLRMRDALVHRGPDDAGWVQPDPSVLLAHRRLSIIDVAHGQQPMCNEDGRIWVTFNGEIFNFRTLRDDLLAKGHQLRSRSDTEVLVHLYEEQGVDMLGRLNGQFAFALWDGAKLLCARDPLGIKPFYYYLDDRFFAFASEPRAFFAAGELDLSIDEQALRLYLRYGYIPAPFSAYRRVRKLRAGEALLVGSDGEPRLERYFDLRRQPIDDVRQVEEAGLREALAEAVSRQCVADFDVGVFLSGGIDSSCVAALMPYQTSERVKSFTIGFPTKDERTPARELASFIGSDHHDAPFDQDDAQSLVPTLLGQLDEPLGDTSLIPTHAVARLARQHTKVALSGDGGDELFVGYGRYLRAIRELLEPARLGSLGRWVARDPATMSPRRWSALDGRRPGPWLGRRIAEREDRRHLSLLGPALRHLARDGIEDPIRSAFERFSELPPLSQVLAVDLETSLPDRLLAKVDRASMMTSLEVRVPLLDLEVVRLAFRLSPAVRLHGGRTKGALQYAMGDALPASVFERKKEGFGPPVEHWFAAELAREIEARLRSSVAVAEGLLDRRAVDALLSPRRGRHVNGPRLWRVVVLESWLRGVRAGRFGDPLPRMAIPGGPRLEAG